MDGHSEVQGEGRATPPLTPDGRYVVVDGVLWRASNPHLSEAERERQVRALIAARRGRGGDARGEGGSDAVAGARAQVQAAKVALGERGPVWWDDGAPDYNRRRVEGTPCAAWWAGQASGER